MLDIVRSAAPPLMPLPILAAVTGISLVIWAYCLRHQQYAVTVFVVVAIGLRYVVSAFHFVTFDPIFLGLSINALLSIAVVALGLLLIDIRLLLFKVFAPVYGLIFIVLLSGLLNAEIEGALDLTIKLAYFVVLTLVILASLERIGAQESYRLIQLAFILPIGLQLLSIVMGLGKATENDGSVSYIGGFNHEAAFSIVLMTFTTLVTFMTSGSTWRRNGFFSLGVFGIIMANYRTTLLAVLPIIMNRIVFGAAHKFVPRQRAIVLFWAIPIMAGLLVVAGVFFQDRFAEVAVAFERSSDLLGDPSEFTEADKKILSGRLFLWSRYINGYVLGTDLQIILGRGPGSWESAFGTYAHNTAISTLYELGPMGVAAMFAVWGVLFAKCWGCPRGPRRQTLIAAHIGFFILNQATMPHWLIEGGILYAIICAATIHAARSTVSLRHDTQQQPLATRSASPNFHPT